MRSYAWLVGISVLIAAMHAPRSARACGGSGPGGTGGCELDLGRSKPVPRLGASVVATDTTLLFGEGRRAEMKRALVFASLSLPLSKRLAFQTSLGGFVAGDLRTPASTTSLGPGVAASLGLSLRAVDGDGASPLVIFNATASGTQAVGDSRQSARHFEAYDLRAGALVGKTIFERVTPYALGRVFGGPVFWRWDDGSRVQGTDLYKFQVGAGVAAKLGPLDLFVEATPLGERSLALGASIAL